MKKTSKRLYNTCCPENKHQGFIFVISLLILLASFYFEFIKGLEPCPLCMMQRLMVLLLVLTSVLGIFITATRASRRLVWGQLLLCLFGVYFAGRQLWLQSLPASELGACLPGLDMLIRYFPWRDVLQALFLGAADCGEITWSWLGLSMAAWSLVYFIVCFITLLFSRYRFFPQ